MVPEDKAMTWNLVDSDFLLSEGFMHETHMRMFVRELFISLVSNEPYTLIYYLPNDINICLNCALCLVQQHSPSVWTSTADLMFCNVIN